MTDKIDVEVDFGYDDEEEESQVQPNQPTIQNGSNLSKQQSLDNQAGVWNNGDQVGENST